VPENSEKHALPAMAAATRNDAWGNRKGDFRLVSHGLRRLETGGP
jgi:hypothetical protein